MCVLAEEKLYSDEFDNIDIQTVFNDKCLTEGYYNCFMETGHVFSEAFQTKCKKYTEKQKIIIEKDIEWFQKDEPEKWNRIITKTLEDTKKNLFKLLTTQINNRSWNVCYIRIISIN
ncbi:OB10 protein, partial [Acromyrmex charruanus]